MNFVLSFDIDNAAFEDPIQEIMDILDHVSNRVSLLPVLSKEAAYRVRDSNGNTVGEWRFR